MEQARAALAVDEAFYGEGHLRMVRARRYVANALVARGEFDQALVIARSARSLVREAWVLGLDCRQIRLTSRAVKLDGGGLEGVLQGFPVLIGHPSQGGSQAQTLAKKLMRS